MEKVVKKLGLMAPRRNASPMQVALAAAGLLVGLALSGGDAAAQGADAGAKPAPAASGSAGPATPPTSPLGARKLAPPAPPPSREQVAALEAMKTEMDAYERGAKDYRDTVTTIIKLHYEAKKREILSGLDREIVIEKGELKKARETAIKRLEEFIATYSGPRAQPEATPDAMYRLAALYEERARSEDATEPPEQGLRPAIALYKRIIVEYPKYRELAGIFYFLGHAYVDSGRMDEGQQVWRSLVCHNRFPYPTPPDAKRPDRDSITPLPQDHDEEYWNAWRNKYRDPKSIRRGNPDTTYTEVYPKDCEAIRQPGLRPGEDPRYVAEIWWQIGNWEFDQLDFGSGVTKLDPYSVWGYNRAASAYSQAMNFKRPPLFGVALYKYAWALFKQQRYELATKEFIKLLNYTDEQQKLTGDPGADFRAEAYTYIAGSLTNVDFAGPGPDEPYILRPDIIDTEPRPDVVEKKLHIAIDRVKDPALIPQDKPWTIEIYRSLAIEYSSLNQYSNAVEVYEMMLKKWPMDPTAPDIQNAEAETFDKILMMKKPGTADHEAAAAKALEARTKLANYIGNTPWVDANKDNPPALQNAERLVARGLRQAAAQHTNNGRRDYQAANETGDAVRQLDLLSRAATEYRLAAMGWQGYLKQDENAPDAYESRYWLADARHNQVRIQVILHKLNKDKFPEPTRKEIDEALTSAIDVRDSNEDDRFLDNAALFVVDVADVDRDLAYQRFEDTKGSAGVQKRDEVKFDSEPVATRKVVREEVPPVVLQSVTARDEYVQRVPSQLDVQKHALEYQFYAAAVYFVYGQFDVARSRLEPMWKEHCTADEYGYRAWEKLITMSNMERDAERSRQLAEAQKAKPCCVSADQCAKGTVIINPTIQEAAYIDARLKFEAAKKAPPGPEREKLWREAAGLYEAALQAAPARDEAPEAAMNAAFAYKQVGEYNKAIDLYNKFISEYGSEALLSKLEKGDKNAKVAPDPAKYEERKKFLRDAFDALGSTYYSFFNYQRAAETYEKVAANERFPEDYRRTAAKNAMTFYANLGQKEKMMAQYRLLLKLKPGAEEKAGADYLAADYDHKQWNPTGSDTGQNRNFRTNGAVALMGYYQNNKATAGAGKYMVEAAYSVAKMLKAGGDTTYRIWLRNTMNTWDAYNRTAPQKDGKSEALLPPLVDYAAEAAFTLLDDEIKAKYDTDAKHRYAGAVADVVGETDANGKHIRDGKYQANAKDADRWDKELERIAKQYPSLEWTPAAIARQGSLFDTLRTGLYNTVPVPAGSLKLFTAKEEGFLKQLENSGRDDLIEKADNLKIAKKEFWRGKKEKELVGADQVMTQRYAQAIAYARKYNVKNAAVQRAVARLAYFTDIIGNAKLKDYVTATKDPNDPSRTLDYKDDMYVQIRPGLVAIPSANGGASTLPPSP